MHHYREMETELDDLNPVRIGRSIKERRKEHGYSLSDVATKANVSSSFVFAVEKGERDFLEDGYKVWGALTDLIHEQLGGMQGA